MDRILVVDLFNFTLNKKVYVIENKSIIDQTEIPLIDAPTIAALAKKYNISNIVLKGHESFTKNIKKDISVNYSNLSVTLM